MPGTARLLFEPYLKVLLTPVGEVRIGQRVAVITDTDSSEDGAVPSRVTKAPGATGLARGSAPEQWRAIIAAQQRGAGSDTLRRTIDQALACALNAC